MDVPMEHGGRVFEYASDIGMALDDIVDFSANINPLGPPKTVWQAIREALPWIRHYPDAKQAAVKAVLSRFTGVPEAWIVCGNGAVEAMEWIVRAWQPRRLVVFDPAFAEYEVIAHRLGIPVLHWPVWTGLGASLGRMAETPVQDGDLVCFNNPHNPSGQVWRRDEWEPVMSRWLSYGARVLVDESFVDFVADTADVTALPWVGPGSRIAVVRSATKMYAIPGLRFGFAVVPPELATVIESSRDPWSVNTLAQAAAAAAYADGNFLEETRRWLEVEHEFLRRAWSGLPGVQRYDTKVNFYLVRMASVMHAEMLARRLAQEGMFVRSCASFRGLDGTYLRIAIKRRSENERLVMAVKAYLERSDVAILCSARQPGSDGAPTC
jgi:threonine-phosphate decarboxylase